MQVQILEQTIFNFLILGKSRFPPKRFYNIDYIRWWWFVGYKSGFMIYVSIGCCDKRFKKLPTGQLGPWPIVPLRSISFWHVCRGSCGTHQTNFSPGMWTSQYLQTTNRLLVVLYLNSTFWYMTLSQAYTWYKPNLSSTYGVAIYDIDCSEFSL